MPPHDASNRDSDSWSRLRRFVDQSSSAENRHERPGLANCKRSAGTPIAASYQEDDEDGQITTRWAVG
jgi:hypothetical protein